MITQNDLLDMRLVFCNIRNSPEFFANKRILSTLITELNSPIHCENKLRTALAKLELADTDEWSFLYQNNLYAYTTNISDPLVYQILESSLIYLLECIKLEEYQKVEALSDILHNLPVYICENSYKIPASFLNNEVAYFQAHWDRDYLKAVIDRTSPSVYTPKSKPGLRMRIRRLMLNITIWFKNKF